MIKEKQREKKKNGAPSGSSIESNGNQCGSNNSGEVREEMKKEQGDKGAEVKEEPEDALPENNSPHNSPAEDSKPSPTHLSDKEGNPLIQNQSGTCKGMKVENGENSEPFRNETCEGVLPMGLPTDNIHEGVQPLPSNVINKQPVTMEAQYMQQQSQIFVFSTALANKAAEAVIQGQYTSIIAYHCAQPRTKKYLEGSNHQGPVLQPQCANNIPIEQNTVKSAQHTNHPAIMPSSNSLMPESMMTSLSDFSQEMGLGSHQPLTGVKVPDEDLTPQQRQHREEQLATLRKMQQILFPEAVSGPTEGAATHVEEVMMPENIDLNKPPVSQSDWHKLHLQFYEEQKLKKGRAAGPPPSYQQATRSASVPVALPSPNPSSPNNTTSNLSLPSPRTCSGINSPADKVNPRIPGPSPTMDSPNPARSANSNPPTPVSIHLSPKHKEKINTTNEFSPSSTVSAPNSQQSPVHSIGPGKQVSNNTPKEPNLMPVPSPQQIQYLNAFEGQELTIQKQPNTSLKEQGRKSPIPSNNSLESVLPTGANEISTKVTGSPTSSTTDAPGRGSFSGEPPTSETVEKAGTQTQRKIESFCNSPQTNERCQMNIPNNYIQKNGPGYLENSSNKNTNLNEKDISNGNYQCMAPDNVPLNPNGINRMNVATANKSHFDPISSLAQMSQQLTNNVPNSPVNQPGMISNIHQNIVPFNSPTSSNPHLSTMNEMHHIQNTTDHRMQNQMPQHFGPNARVQCNNNLSPNMSVSPKLMQGYGVPQRPMPRGMPYTGANVQVKPNAPNTIQYLPSRPQTSNGPRGPPSLDFLRFSNPLSNLDAKVPTHNLQYFPNNYPQNNMNEMGLCPPHGNIRGPGSIRAPNTGIMRLQSPQMSPMGFNNTEMFSNSNCQMFVPPAKSAPMGMAPDASQPLPPSMGQSNNFKNSTFIGPTTADPNYAQQFHNFQQQLYATNTRGQLNSQTMGTNQHYFIPK